jgi:hypothetical protein
MWIVRVTILNMGTIIRGTSSLISASPPCVTLLADVYGLNVRIYSGPTHTVLVFTMYIQTYVQNTVYA